MDIKIGEAAPLFKPLAGNESQQTDGGFAAFFNDTINELNAMTHASRAKQERFVTHGDVELQDVMIAGQEAELALKLTMQIRSKVLEAYREIMRMPV